MSVKPISELLDLSGKVAIVTGGAKGIGWGISYRLAEAGAYVVVADIDEVAAKEAAVELTRRGRRSEAVAVDVGSKASVEALIAGVIRSQGSIDILVNNAGIYPSCPVSDMSEELFDRVMRVNLRSVFLTTKYVSEVMKRQGGGKIINVTSIDALHPSMVGLAHYDASKHGAWGFTKNSALELAPFNIAVNAIAPGGITTPGTTGLAGPPNPDLAAATAAFLQRIPMGRMGEPDEIGTVALFLASDMAAYLTGSQLVVDGGALLT